jgi:hypothetical protein
MPASIWATEQEIIRKKMRGKHGLLSMVFLFVTPVTLQEKKEITYVHHLKSCWGSFILAKSSLRSQ